MEIAPGVHRIKCVFGENRMVYVHLLVGDQASMLVDTGCAHNPEQEILPYMASIGLDAAKLTYIVISHSDLDHQGGNRAMKKAAPNAILMCHDLDAAWVGDTEAIIKGRYSQFEADHGIGYGDAGKDGIRKDCLSAPLDMTLSGGEHFRLGKDWIVEAVHTPGHTWGHLAIYDPRSKLLVAGEASIGSAILTDDWQPAMPPTYCYVDTYLATQNQMLAMDIAVFSSAHWPLKRGSEVKDFILESKNFCLLVERKLLEYAAQKPGFTLRQAIDDLSLTLGDYPPGSIQDFSYGMLGNLNSLTQRGKLVAGRNANNLMTWSLPK